MQHGSDSTGSAGGEGDDGGRRTGAGVQRLTDMVASVTGCHLEVRDVMETAVGSGLRLGGCAPARARGMRDAMCGGGRFHIFGSAVFRFFHESCCWRVNLN